MIALSRNCPGRGESQRRQCRCGAIVYSYMGYETTAQRRIYEDKTGLVHDCPALRLSDVIECACGDVVRRYDDGRKENMDRTPHTCGRKVAVTIAPHATPPAAPKPPQKPVNPTAGWKGVVSTEIHRNPGA